MTYSMELARYFTAILDPYAVCSAYECTRVHSYAEHTAYGSKMAVKYRASSML